MTKVAAVNQGLEVDFVDLEDLALDGGEERLRGAIKANTKVRFGPFYFSTGRD